VDLKRHAAFNLEIPAGNGQRGFGSPDVIVICCLPRADGRSTGESPAQLDALLVIYHQQEARNNINETVSTTHNRSLNLLEYHEIRVDSFTMSWTLR
jgi:hypothetical protein